MARSRGAQARDSTASASSTTMQTFASPATRTTKIPLNDDNAEKAKRLKERSLLHSIQKDKMKAVASPGRRLTVGSGASPKTPRNVGVRQSTVGPGEGDSGLLDTVTPLRKVPILANFEEWMKMATDNKINAANSWNFALIDYFHEMSLLREGDSVNFQKASCTLDGCVKIYTSRVDSVATETGKLLSGLADSYSRKKGRGDGDDDDGEGSDAEDGEGRPKQKKRVQRSSETTLAKDFSALQAKKFDLEFSVDPLFKKASADFDEGGAKGLLLNHLSIDNNGRIVFDSSDDREDRQEEADAADDENEDADVDGTAPAKKPAAQPEAPEEDDDIKDPAAISTLLSGLREKFLPDLTRLDGQDICPSLKNFDLGDPAGSLDNIPFLKSLEERNENADGANGGVGSSDDGGGMGGGMDMAFGFDDGFGVGGDDDDDVTMGAFGEGGEAWANGTIADAAEHFLSPAKRPMLGLGGGDSQADTSTSRDFTVGFGGGHEDILAYFDDAMKKNWAGPEHWKIRRIKDSSKAASVPVRQRKEKEAFTIDFLTPSADAPAELLNPPKTLATITLPKKDRISKTRHLLPDDKHFSSRQLLRLFLKPKASLRRQRHGGGGGGAKKDDVPENIDEEFWAKENMAKEIQASSTPQPNAPTYDANFFADSDGLDLPLPSGADDLLLPSDAEDDEDIFADAREMFSPAPETDAAAAPAAAVASSQPADGAFGKGLLAQTRRVRPEYVQYARVAKKVDVRRLKENIWTGLAYEDAVADANRKRSFGSMENPVEKESGKESGKEDGVGAGEGEDGTRLFTQTMRELRRVYPEKTMADISTSYCFICLLHLANEKGLEIAPHGAELTELVIRKDREAYGRAEGY